MKSPDSRFFFIAETFISNSVFLLVTDLFRFSIFFHYSALVSGIFLKNFPFLLVCSVWWCVFFHSSLLNDLLISVVSECLFSFIMLIWFLSLFSLVKLGKGLSILYIFSKKNGFVWLILFFSVLCFIYFLSKLYFSFFFSKFGLNLFFFLIPQRLELGHLFDIFLLLNIGVMYFPLRPAFSASHKFWYIVFPFLF